LLAAKNNPALRQELEALAAGYIRLAVQADINNQNDIVFEERPRSDGMRSQQVQQQQSRCEKKRDEQD
jgi:hypothetical protein